MKLISWNVNGIRAAIKKGFVDAVHSFDADVLCLQETRATPEQAALSLAGYEQYWNPAEKKGYSGTAVFSRVPINAVRLGLGKAVHDQEGRVITAEFEDFFLVNVYTPNSKRGLARLDYRTTKWDPAFRKYLKSLEKTKPVVFCGDLNVAHREIDLANPRSNRQSAGFTDEERGTFDALLGAGFVDTFRVFCQDGGHYSWWSNFGKARERNVGWRIDYFGASQVLQPRLRRAAILPEIMGSDHCPVLLEII